MTRQGNLLARNLVEAEDITSDDRLFAMLAYISQLIIPLVLPVFILVSQEHKKQRFQRYHALHAIGLIPVVIILSIVIIVVYFVLTIITAGCLGLILWVLFFLPIVPFLYYGYLAHQGYYFEIPLVTDIVRSYLE